MPPSVYASGSQTCVIGTEHFVSSPNTPGVFKFGIDPVLLAAQETLEVRVYKMAVAGGTQRVIYYQRYDGAQITDDMIKEAVFTTALTDTNATRCSIKQTAGTGRVIPWYVEKM